MKAKEIKAIRKKLSISQQELAAAAGVSVSSIKAWETGKRSISSVYEQILKALISNDEIKREVTLKPGETLIVKVKS